MKKITKGLLFIFTLLILVSCSGAKGDFQFKNMSKEYKVKDSYVDLYFKEDSDIAYIDVYEFIHMLNGVYYSKEFEFIKDLEKETLTINIEAEYDDEVISENLTLNVIDNNITVSNLDFFSIYIKQTETNYSEGLISLDPIIEKGDSIIYNLTNYEFDILLIEESFYMPLFLTNLIFNQETYFDVYFNGETLYGIDTGDLSNKDMKKISKSKYNEKEASEEIIKASYNYAKFITDYFYGLKEERNIKDSNDFVSLNNFINGDLNKNIFDFTKTYDDLHSSHIMKGYYNNNLKEFNYEDDSNLGINIKKFQDGILNVQTQAIDYFGVKNNYINIPDKEIINGDTLVIYITGFDVSTPKEIESIIKQTDSNNINNIIIDLTFNTGGNLGAVLRIFTLMTNEDIRYQMINKLDNSKVSYGVKGENPAYEEYNYYIKSSSITYSAANLMVSIAKDLNIKVLGTKSSGGASPISFHIFPNGSIINISSNDVLANKNYESIEYGIRPDYVLDNLYDNNEILKYMGR